jgi:F-type H+-transporting ATPase subunit gamma
MGGLREIKRRIVSVKSTRQITKAMKMVAAAKLRKAQEAVAASRPYASKMAEVIGALGAVSQEAAHPLLAKREEKNVLILVFSSDKGLCGAFNANVFKAVHNVIRENEGKGIYVSVVGKKGRDFWKRRNVMMEKAYVDYTREINYQFAQKIAKDVIETFIHEKVDKIFMVYNKFRSAAVQDPTAVQLLPMEPAGGKKDDAAGGDILFEPSAQAVLSAIVEKYVEVQIFQALIESWASENGSKLVAMDNATRNAGDMINALTLQYNRARQAAITKELIEIVSGADALKS